MAALRALWAEKLFFSLKTLPSSIDLKPKQSVEHHTVEKWSYYPGCGYGRSVSVSGRWAAGQEVEEPD